MLRDGKPIETIQPEKRRYWCRTPCNRAGIASRWNMDLFAALGDDLGAGRWSFRAQIRPLIDYIWLRRGLDALVGARQPRSTVIVCREPGAGQRRHVTRRRTRRRHP